jgi:hypothetical protein
MEVFLGIESYRKFSYRVLWNKGLNPYNSYENPIKSLFHRDFEGFQTRGPTSWKESFVSISPHSYGSTK